VVERVSVASGPVPAAAAGCAGRLAVRRLILTDFRSYTRATVESDGRPAALTGPNGAGKTNLLEAISFLGPGRGLRRAKLSEVDRRIPGADAAAPEIAWAVAAALDTPDGDMSVGTGRDPARAAGEGGEKRLVKLDGELCRGQQPLAERMSLIWLTPQMDRLFLEGASGRRRFLDRLVYGIDPAHAGRVSSYEHAMRERARLLRMGRADDRWLGALEGTMAEKGVAVAAARRDLAERLRVHMADAPDGVFPRPVVGLTGAVEDWLETMSALQAEDRLREGLAAGRNRDAEAGGTAVGPHRTDLAVRHAAKDMPAADCSTGEQKALLIALVLANARLQTHLRGMAPLLLLDEIAAHLDGHRRAALADAIVDLGAQAWMTGTDRRLFEVFGERAQHFTVDDGRVEPTASPVPSS